MTGDEADQASLASDPLEELHALRLCSEEQSATWRACDYSPHQLAPDTAALVCRVDQDLRHGRQEVAVGQQSNASDEAVAVPRTDVRRTSQCRCHLGKPVTAGPDLLAEGEELVGPNAVAVSDGCHLPNTMVSGSQVLLNEARTEMDVDLNERRVANAAKAVNLSGFDNENVTGPGFEFLSVDVPEAAAFPHDLHFIVRMAVRPRPAPRKGAEEKDGDVDVAVVGSDELMRTAHEGQVFLANAVHGGSSMAGGIDAPCNLDAIVSVVAGACAGFDTSQPGIRSSGSGTSAGSVAANQPSSSRASNHRPRHRSQRSTVMPSRVSGVIIPRQPGPGQRIETAAVDTLGSASLHC